MSRSSDLHVINQYAWAGKRNLADSSRPLRLLVAGCGTGDAVFVLAAQASTWAPHAEVVALDFSHKSLEHAKKRLAAWPAQTFTVNITFVQGSILSLASMGLGKFDFINCMGVLHHIADPPKALRQLEQVLQPDGGIGLMLYAAYGRQAVASMSQMAKLIQQASGKAPRDRQTIESVRWLRSVLPEHHEIHEWQGGERDEKKHLYPDEALVDDFLHPHYLDYKLHDVLELLEGAGMKLSGFVLPALYNPVHHTTADAADLANITSGMSWIQQAQLAEHMSSILGKHSFFAVKKHRSTTATPVRMQDSSVPLIRAECLLSKVLEDFESQPEMIESGQLKFTHDYLGVRTDYSFPLPPNTLEILPLFNGQHTIAEITDFVQAQVAAKSTPPHHYCPSHANLTSQIRLLAGSFLEMGHLALMDVKLQSTKIPVNNRRTQCKWFKAFANA